MLSRPIEKLLVIGSVLWIASCATPGSAAVLVERSQSFDSDPNWSLIGNSIESNDFGYGLTSFAGGSSGEAGGRFTRSTIARYYADTDLIRQLTLADELLGAGRLDITEHADSPDFGQPMWIGHFDTTAPANFATNKIGIFLNNGATGSQISWGVGVRFGTNGKIVSEETALTTNVDREFSYQWIPNGGAFGAGRLVGTLSGPGGGTKFVDLTPEYLAMGAFFDAFGMNGGFPVPADTNPSRFAEIYIDDVRYTVSIAEIPEPASIAVWAILGLVTTGLASRRFRHVA